MIGRQHSLAKTLPSMERDAMPHKRINKRINELLRLRPGWDGYEGRPVTFENASFAMAVLEACCGKNDPIPQIVPGPSGDLQLEWHLEKGDIELHILAPSILQAWHVNEQTGDDGEDVLLTNDFTAVAEWLKSLATVTMQGHAAQN